MKGENVDKLTVLNNTWMLGYVSDDPVRPHLSALFRTDKGREVYALTDEDTGVIKAIVCVAYTDVVPTTEEELDEFSKPEGKIAIFYTIWSYSRGGGRDLINQLWEHMKDKRIAYRFVTLSPPTDMARKFHLKNGAFELSDNTVTVNYEYSDNT